MRPLLTLFLLLGASPVSARHPFGFDDLIRARRLGAFDVSPDGKSVAYAVSTIDVVESKSTSAIWMTSLADGTARQLTTGSKHDRDPAFSPDGKQLAFVSDRDGAPQIYLIDLGGGEARALTHLKAGADGPQWSPDGKFLLFSSEVFPECTTEACNTERAERRDKSKSSGRVIERLMFRRWDSFKEGKRTHLFRVERAGGDPRDLTPGNFDTPPFSLGGDRDYDISPDSKTIAFGSNHDAIEAISTNSDIWEIPANGGAALCRSCDNKAFDGTPRYSPDGKYLSWRSQRVPGYESDQFELRIIDRSNSKSAPRTLAPKWTDWVDDYSWSPDSQRLYFTSVVKARMPVFAVKPDGSEPETVIDGVTAAGPRALPDGSLIYSRVSLTRPAELWHGKSQLTHINDVLFDEVTMGAVRERSVDIGEGGKLQALVVVPPDFDEKKKYPALFWVHGGPQGAWEDGWSYRWNPEVLASAGYVVYLPNPRGSTGYGQEFVRGVSADWGGKVFDDLMHAADDLESLPYVQKGKIGAAGASFGGFMINWFQGHTDRFKALFCHDGIADQQTMYATEELWFPEYEFKGQPWNSEHYRKWSPIESASNFKTPEMIVHGEKDYRIPCIASAGT